MKFTRVELFLTSPISMPDIKKMSKRIFSNILDHLNRFFLLNNQVRVLDFEWGSKKQKKNKFSNSFNYVGMLATPSLSPSEFSLRFYQTEFFYFKINFKFNLILWYKKAKKNMFLLPFFHKLVAEHCKRLLSWMVFQKAKF